MHNSSSGIVALLLTALSLTAQADVVEIEWDGAGRFEKTVALQPGKFAELCGKLSPGEKIRWSFKSEAPLNFNIHYHEGPKVSYPVKQADVTVADGVLDVAQQQDYCWMWSNRAAAQTALQIVLQR